VLRNSIQAKILGLACQLLAGCSSPDESHRLFPGLTIKADPYYEYRIRNILEASLRPYANKLKNTKIKITIRDKEEQAAFSEKETLIESKRISSHVELFDAAYNTLFETRLDSFATYGVSDEFPYSGISAQKSATEDMLNDIGNSISLAISAFINKLSADGTRTKKQT
jgi:hypothetical protein